MRLIVMGQQAFGKDVLDKLLTAGTDEVVAVYCEPDRAGKPVDLIKEFALEKGLSVHQPASFDTSEGLATLATHEADLMVMAFVNVFVPEAARDTPKMGSICFHPSVLPRHRGPSAVNWPIIMGATKSGYSWFYPTDGLDEGDSLLQWECDLGPDDTVIDLYFKKIYPAAVDSVLEVCDLFRAGNPPRIVSDETRATYERRCTKKHARIDWNKPVKQVYDLIRGTNPAPGAWTLLDGAEVKIYDSARLAGDGVSGRIVDVSGEGVAVQCIGGRILIKRVNAGGGKIPAAQWASEAGHGDRGMIRKILVPVRGDGKGDNVLAHAAALAHKHHAHIVVSHCRPRAQDLMPYGVPIPDFLRKQMLDQATQVADMEAEGLMGEIEVLAGRLDLTASDKPLGNKASVSFVEEAGRQVDVIKRNGRLCDLIAVAQPDVSRNLGSNTLKAALFHSGRPVLMCPTRDGAAKSLGRVVAIAWNGSAEAARALAQSMEVIRNADRVYVLSNGSDSGAGTTVADLSDYLTAHGVSAEVETFDAEAAIAKSLLEKGNGLGCDVLIMGAYGDSHERETMFGGNTQNIVDHASMPVLFSH